MTTLTQLVSQISPYSVENPTGSKRVSYISGPVSDESLIKSYWVEYSNDGDSSDFILIEIRCVDSNWFFNKTPPFLLRKNSKFADKVEEQVVLWWQSTGKNLFVSRSAVRVNDADLKYGYIDLVSINTSITPHKIFLSQKFFVKINANDWDICDMV